MRRSGGVLRLVTAVTLLAGLLLSAQPAPANQIEEPAVAVPPVVDIDEPAVQHLIEEYGISAEQAVKQATNQILAEKANAEMPATLRRRYSGVKIEHADGGKVEVGVSGKADDVEAYFANLGVANIEITSHEFNESEPAEGQEVGRGQTFSVATTNSQLGVNVIQSILNSLLV